MTDFILDNETLLRLSVFLFILFLMMGLEALFPRKQRALPRGRRWIANLGLIFVDGLFVKLIFPVIAVGAAAFAVNKGWGGFNLVDWPVWLETTCGLSSYSNFMGVPQSPSCRP